MDEPPGVVIRYNDRLVGYFDHGLVPDRPGRYAYMPFRNAAHLEMAQAAMNGARPRCSISHDGKQVSFEVIAMPEPHVMVLAKLETRPHER